MGYDAREMCRIIIGVDIVGSRLIWDRLTKNRALWYRLINTIMTTG